MHTLYVKDHESKSWDINPYFISKAEKDLHLVMGAWLVQKDPILGDVKIIYSLRSKL